MAFSNNPQYSTYRQENIKFDGSPGYRSGDLSVQRDLQIVNMYYDRVSQENKEREVKLRKRAGLSATTYSLSKSAASDVIRGSYYDVDQNAFYWSVNNKVYSINPNVGTTVRTVATLATSSGYVGFCSFLKADDTRLIIITDGTDLWVDDYVALTCTEVTGGGAANLPTPHQPYPVYLNGVLYLIETSTGKIWNSDEDDPASWTSASAFVQAEISSDYALRLLKAKNYLVCLGYNSAEYFWDAGNAAPDSPLSRNDSPVRGIGYVTGLCTIGDFTYFVGQDEKKNLAVYMLNSFKVDRISNPVVDRTLETFSTANNAKGNVNLSQDGYSISVDGHTFYVLRTPQTTWVYEVDDKLWYEFKNSAGTGLAIEAVWGMYNGACYLAIANQTTFSIMSPTNYQDFGANFTCRYTTESTDFGTHNWKVCNKVSLACSMHAYTGTSNASISWSDNDWGDGGTTARNINVFSSSPYITRLGKFRSRSFRVEYADNYPFWATGLQLSLNVGQI